MLTLKDISSFVKLIVLQIQKYIIKSAPNWQKCKYLQLFWSIEVYYSTLNIYGSAVACVLVFLWDSV